MTVITKAISEKKPDDKLEQPLVVPVQAPNEGTTSADPEAQYPKKDFVVHKRFLIIGSNKLSNVTTYCLFMTGLLIMLMGVFGGLCIYKLYAREQMHKFRTGWFTVPYDQKARLEQLRQDLLSDPDLGYHQIGTNKEPFALKLQKALDNHYFQEKFEIDLDAEYENIDVPDFRGGRQGRFIHDFGINKTGIIDIEGECCFVMPLDRRNILPPRSMVDLLKKVYRGYYEVDTEVVRETMRIVFPAITDYSTVGTYITRECQNMPTYMLAPVNEKRHKRSTTEGVYGQFAGKSIVEFDILNVESVLKKQK